MERRGRTTMRNCQLMPDSWPSWFDNGIDVQGSDSEVSTMGAGVQLVMRLSEILNPWPWLNVPQNPWNKSHSQLRLSGEKCSHWFVQWNFSPHPVECWTSGNDRVLPKIQEHETLTIGLSENTLDIWSTEWCTTSRSLRFSDFASGFYFGNDHVRALG